MSSSSDMEELLKDIHRHTLELFCLDKKADIRSCEACNQAIFDDSYYNCPKDGCDCFLHKYCAELPMEVMHKFHPSHPLKVASSHPYRWCNACRNNSEGLYYYSCEECYFDLDFFCATLEHRKLGYHGDPHRLTPRINNDSHISSPPKQLSPPTSISISSRNTNMLKHVIHGHTFELIRLNKKADIRSCAACTQVIIDDNYYSCPDVGCYFFLHEVCGDLPLKIKHAFHRSHPLRLRYSDFVIRSYRRGSCDACAKEYEGFYYNCEECCLELDLVCATQADRKLKYPGHPHPLTPTRSEIEAYCNCCGKEHKGIFYHCQECAIFWIHENCAALGPDVNSPKHPHPLQFVYSMHDIWEPYGTRCECDICHEILDSNRSWHLVCGPCDFVAHVYCAMKEDKNDLVQEIDPEVPRLPWEGCDEEFGIVGLLNRKIAANDEVEKEMMKISHFSHPEHELFLQAEVPKVEDPYHGHKIPLITKCNGCTRKISSPFYSCVDCDFFLHKCCAFLPSSISRYPFHLDHHGKLVQNKNPWRVEKVFLCYKCRNVCNGFYFQCEEEGCTYKVDVECAFLPTSIVHKSHPHLLTLKMYSDDYSFPSTGCCGLSYIDPAYECLECKYEIHLECAMYPGRASHRYDHIKQFTLWYDRGAVEANKFYCERCEEFMGPKSWYYHSRTSIGDQLMHPRCILQQEHPKMFNFKSTKNFLRLDIHPHRLHLSLWTKIISSEPQRICNYCQKLMPKREINLTEDEITSGGIKLSYTCWDVGCHFILHHSCATELLGTNSTGVEEYLLLGTNSTGVEEYPDEGS